MEDLDLDELDQAVTKIMDKPKGKRAKKSPAVPAQAPASAAQAVTVTRRDPLVDPEPAPADEPPKAPAPLPVRPMPDRPMPKVPPRRRTHPGAMDIIQPSAPKMNAPSGRPTRVAPDVQPTSPVTPEPTKPTPAAAAEPSPATHTDVSDEVLAALNMLDEPKHAPASNKPEPKKDAEAWPDPLDFHDFEGKDDANPIDKPVDAPTSEPDKKEDAPTLAATPEPSSEPAEDTSSTPFVMTKVEKRPLGAFASHSPEPTPTTPAEVPKEDAPVPQKETSKEDMAKASLESSQHQEQKEDDHDMNDLRQMSIPQQYRSEQPKPHDEVHSLYDTKEYHAAPQAMHTAHKGSALVTISVVVLIVLIIAAVAVGYFMMTGTFDITKLL